MNNSAIAISTLGMVSSIFTFVINTLLLKKLLKNKSDMILFFYRFSIDAMVGFSMGIFLIIIMVYCFSPTHFDYLQELIFYVSLPSSNIGAARSVVALIISVERNIAAYFPIFFHNNRKKFPTVILLTFAVLFGLLEDVVLYGFCDFHLNMAPNCAAFGCAVNSCFFRYWSGYKTIISALSMGLALTLSVKLFILNKFSGEKNENLSRANQLALIDAVNLFFFDLFPHFVANQFSNTGLFSFQNLGPYMAVAKVLGFAIEACLAYRTFSRNAEIRPVSDKCGCASELPPFSFSEFQLRFPEKAKNFTSMAPVSYISRTCNGSGNGRMWINCPENSLFVHYFVGGSVSIYKIGYFTRFVTMFCDETTHLYVRPPSEAAFDDVWRLGCAMF